MRGERALPAAHASRFGLGAALGPPESFDLVVQGDVTPPWASVREYPRGSRPIHWPTQGGYNFVSGPLADITLITAFASALYLWLRKHNCHVHRCWRLQWHPHPEHGHPVCRKHHPDGHGLPA